MQTIYMGSAKCKGPNLNLVLTSYVKTLQERGSNQQTVGRSVTPERHGPYLAAMFDKKCHGNPAATYIASAENHVHRQSCDLT